MNLNEAQVIFRHILFSLTSKKKDWTYADVHSLLKLLNMPFFIAIFPEKESKFSLFKNSITRQLSIFTKEDLCESMYFKQMLYFQYMSVQEIESLLIKLMPQTENEKYLNYQFQMMKLKCLSFLVNEYNNHFDIFLKQFQKSEQPDKACYQPDIIEQLLDQIVENLQNYMESLYENENRLLNINNIRINPNLINLLMSHQYILPINKKYMLFWTTDDLINIIIIIGIKNGKQVHDIIRINIIDGFTLLMFWPFNLISKFQKFLIFDHSDRDLQVQALNTLHLLLTSLNFLDKNTLIQLNQTISSIATNKRADSRRNSQISTSTSNNIFDDDNIKEKQNKKRIFMSVKEPKKNCQLNPKTSITLSSQLNTLENSISNRRSFVRGEGLISSVLNQSDYGTAILYKPTNQILIRTLTFQPLMDLIDLKERNICVKINKKLHFIGMIGLQLDKETQIYFDIKSESFILKNMKDEMQVKTCKLLIQEKESVRFRYEKLDYIISYSNDAVYIKCPSEQKIEKLNGLNSQLIQGIKVKQEKYKQIQLKSEQPMGVFVHGELEMIVGLQIQINLFSIEVMEIKN